MVTMPMPIMDSGSRPTKPAAENDLLPGAAKMARYGLGKGCSPVRRVKGFDRLRP